MSASIRSDGSAPAPAMTPERWRAVDAVLLGALSREDDRREAFIREACGEDAALLHEVESLLAAHDGMSADFLEQPPAETLGPAPMTGGERAATLANALDGRYVIESEIARGGMATVYRALDVRHARRVAIKVMREEVAAAIGAERFLEEIRVTASLQHPNILPLFDSGQHGGLLWYVMPFVDGETLRSRLAREGRLPVGEAIRLARQVGAALEHAHAHGIVHRDIKPENVLLQGSHALVADFGIALALDHAGGERLTKTGLTLGTPQYMAPEQAAGERALDARVDVYALGAVTYEMLAGQSPFAAPTRQAVVQRMLGEMPSALVAFRGDVPPSLDAAVVRAMAKRPDDRFASAEEFAAALITDADAIRSASTLSRPNEHGAPAVVTARPGRRAIAAHIVIYAVSAGIVLGLVIGMSLSRWSIFGSQKSAPPPARWPAVAAIGATVPSADAKIIASGASDAPSLVVVDRGGHVQQGITANRPWTPRFSPDGHRVAFGAYGAGRTTSDLWIADLDASTTWRLTDDDGDSNDPQWSPDGKAIAFSVNAPDGKDVAIRRLTGDTATRIVAALRGMQFPSDWLHDGRALILTENGPDRYDILVQPVDGSAARPCATAGEHPTSGRVSPNERWIAYTSQAWGRANVYLASYPGLERRLTVSDDGGADPVWRGDGRELYYWRGDTLVAVKVDAQSSDTLPTLGAATVLFRTPYQSSLNTMYDVSPDGQRFAIVQRR